MKTKALRAFQSIATGVAGVAANGAILAAFLIGFFVLMTSAMAKSGPSLSEFLAEVWPLIAGVVAGSVADILIIAGKWKAALVAALAAAGLVIFYIQPMLGGA